ncbi:MAG: dihydroorotase, partial [Pseudomonadota bacterium]|nr:dihydroorotase [Pseudomonadota bacterium]
ALVMPNLNPPVTTVEQALDYRERILAVLPAGSGFDPLMTLYLTDNTPVTEIERAARSEHILGAKLYPAGATTNSDSGVTGVSRIDDVLAAMAETGLVLEVHGEVTDPGIDVFDREVVFIEHVLTPVTRRHPCLRIVLEHITTRAGIEFVNDNGEGIAGTLTAHHLLLNRNALFQGGLRPHHYCLPVLKRERHRQALLEAAASGSPKFFLGTDSAPHGRTSKESPCGCAGIYTAHAALALYAMAFEEVDALNRLEGFASFHGADFYGLPRNHGRITLQRNPWEVPKGYTINSGDNTSDELTPLFAGETLPWSVRRTEV